VNPRVGSALQQTRVASEEQAVEVVETTRTERGRAVAGWSRRWVREDPPGVDSGVARTTEGRSLDNPKRGSPVGQPTGSTDWKVSGKAASKVRRVVFTLALRMRVRSERGSSKTSNRARAWWRTSGGRLESQYPELCSGSSPHLAMVPRKGDPSGDGAREAMFRAERGYDPEDPMNPIPGRLPAESVRWIPVQTV
jgi:hypothetical protein